MKLTIKAKGLEMTAAIKKAVEAKIVTLDAKVKRFGDSVTAEVEVGRTTKHHSKGRVFRAEIHVRLPGKLVYAACVHEDLYDAINDVKKEAERQIMTYKGAAEKKVRAARKAKAK